MNNERYISVEKAISILRLRSQQLAGMYGDIGGAASGAALILERLADEETEDLVPVVRCMDCVFAERCEDNVCWWCERNDMRVLNDFFCADGERRE